MAVDPKIKQKAEDIRKKIFGSEVRESLASGLEEMSSDVVENEGRQSVVESRQDSVESQWQNVVDETTGKDVISAPEIIAARDGEANLKARLDKEHNEVTTQLAHTNLYNSSSKNTKSVHLSKKPAITFIVDDANSNDLIKTSPIFEEYNIPYGIGVITNWVGKTFTHADFGGIEQTYLTWEQIRELQRKGAEILSHTHNHLNMRDSTKETIEFEMKTSLEKLAENGFVVDGFIYPYNARNATSTEISKKYYKYCFARSYTQDFSLKNLSNFNINRYALGSFYDGTGMSDGGLNTNTLEYYKERIDKAIARNEWCVFVLHTLTNSMPAIQQQHLRETIAYAKTKSIDIVSPREGYERFGNVIELDAVKLRADGTSNINNTVTIEPDATDVSVFNRGPNTFKSNPITVTHIDGSIASSSPKPLPFLSELKGFGELITHYYGEHSDMCYQDFKGYIKISTDIIEYEFTRRTKQGDSAPTWTKWQPRQSEFSIPHISDAGLFSRPATDFCDDVITRIAITSNLENSPFKSYGELITYKNTKSGSLIRQRYIGSHLNAGDPQTKIFVRYWYNDVWTTWKQESSTV